MQRDRDVVFSKKTEKESCAMVWFLFPLHATTILLGLLVMAYARGKSQCWLEATLYSPFYSLPFFSFRTICVQKHYTVWQAERSYNNFFWESQRQHRIFCVYCMQFPSNFIIIQYVVLQSVICSCNSYLFLGTKKKVVARYYLISFCFLAFGFVA